MITLPGQQMSLSELKRIVAEAEFTPFQVGDYVVGINPGASKTYGGTWRVRAVDAGVIGLEGLGDSEANCLVTSYRKATANEVRVHKWRELMGTLVEGKRYTCKRAPFAQYYREGLTLKLYSAGSEFTSDHNGDPDWFSGDNVLVPVPVPVPVTPLAMTVGALVRRKSDGAVLRVWAIAVGKIQLDRLDQVLAGGGVLYDSTANFTDANYEALNEYVIKSA